MILPEILTTNNLHTDPYNGQTVTDRTACALTDSRTIYSIQHGEMVYLQDSQMGTASDKSWTWRPGNEDDLLFMKIF